MDSYTNTYFLFSTNNYQEKLEKIHLCRLATGGMDKIAKSSIKWGQINSPQT